MSSTKTTQYPVTIPSTGGHSEIEESRVERGSRSHRGRRSVVALGAIGMGVVISLAVPRTDASPNVTSLAGEAQALHVEKVALVTAPARVDSTGSLEHEHALFAEKLGIVGRARPAGDSREERLDQLRMEKHQLLRH
ncbi:MAG: hypothetical protein R3249_02035 [Nitriliruptorales bacterium]|nr:hypothetical protein [Nitriliruptorales bacterium]